MLNALASVMLLASLTVDMTTAELGDTISVALDSVVVTAKRNTSGMRASDFGAARLDMSLIEALPQILGNSDPVHYAQMLPGVQTNGELRSGLNVQGFDNQHTQFSVEGVPLYGVAHLMGIFSAFNPSHYSGMVLEKTPVNASSPSRLGGNLGMQISEEPSDSANGTLSVGIMSSQGTLRIPIKERTQLTISGRGSYLNLLYGPLLKMDDDTQIKYGFFDANATLLHHINDRHSIMANFYMGQDKGGVYNSGYQNDVSVRWGNHLASVQWMYEGREGWQTKHVVYNTRYYNRMYMDFPDIHASLPSSIMDFGYKGEATYRGLSFGADFTYHIIQPQDPHLQSSYNVVAMPQEEVRSRELSLWADYTQHLGDKLILSGGVRYILYNVSGSTYHAADPSVRINYRPADNLSLSLGYALRHQNLFQTGMSSIGLPCEFWLSSGGTVGDPQWGHGPVASAALSLLGGSYRISVDAYYKWLHHQIEYQGNYMSFINSIYSLDDALLHGNGRNYGMSVMLSKCSGRLTGWVSYSLGRALRTYDCPKLSGTFPANHERIHEMNAVLTWKASKRWSFGGTFVLASGTPFTAPEAFYLLNGRILSQYAEHNANRLPAYIRLDLSANCQLGSLSRRWKHFVNISLYNATARHNALFYSIGVSDDARFRYQRMYFMPFPLPSISYTVKF